MSVVLHEIDLPLRIRTGGPMTDADFVRFCAANEPARFERDANGEIIAMSPGFAEGGGAELEVGTDLMIWTRADGRGKAFGPNAGFTLPDGSIRMADASWIALVRWNALTEQQREWSFASICPEFVIEVRSKTDRLKALREKMEMWIANGAQLAWLIDPERKLVEVYRAGEPVEVFENPTSVQGTGPVQGFELVMGRVWS